MPIPISKSYPITPDMINTGKHFFDSFGSSEAEVSANWLVRLCQARGTGWAPFTTSVINGFYKANMKPQPYYGDFSFNGMQDYLLLEDETYHFTHEFVSRCFMASPKLK